MIDEIDAFGGTMLFMRMEADARGLRSRELIGTYLISVVKRIGMQAIDAPTIHVVDENLAKTGVEPFTDDGGITGFIPLSSSHCAIHTWPLRGQATILIYSCVPFDIEAAIDETRTAFEPSALVPTDLTKHALINNPKQAV